MITKDDLTKRIAAAMIARNSLRSGSTRGVANAMKNSSLLAFQKADGTLTADGLYGPNSKAALTWYLQSSSDKSVPEVNPKLAKTSKGLAITVTWKAPELAPAPAPAPAKAPATAPATVPAKAPATGGMSSLMSGLAASAQKGYVDTSIKAGGTGKAPVKTYAKAPTKAKAKKKAKKKVKEIAKAIGPLPAYGQELLAHNVGKIDAEDVISAVATGAPVVNSALKSMDAESNIAEAFSKIQSKGLKGIKKTLLREALQKEATSEHRSLSKQDNFRRTVLAELKNIKAELARRKAGKMAEDYRIVGLML